MKVGIIGNGFVGEALYEGFSPFVDVLVYDILDSKRLNTYDEVISCDFIFVCLPTPMIDVEGGSCNLSIIENFFTSLPSNVNGILIIKSTVPIGTTERLSNEYKHLKIIHNPEFLTAVNAAEDFLKADRHILGGDVSHTRVVKTLYDACFPQTPVCLLSSKESESVKYFSNCFLASKLMIFNEFKLLMETLDIDYDNVLSGLLMDSRIGLSHYSVPGVDGQYGFGGTCFPKDINALITTMKDNDLNPLVLQAVWEQNKLLRTDWDWARSSSAVLGKPSNT